ncbi:non-receptor serine/threonine protein kinase [Lithospermum erythrorhizon]|uniref:Non-receptor serine/threonine protein kinase n=1 Tax=Lithospermum erythrorhizon TaxID=34254 RepID=A0AAV3PLJ4_LITER
MKDMIIQQEEQQVHLEDNMSNLTSASAEASGSSGTRNEDINGGLLYTQQYYLSTPPPIQTHSQPAKKKRNLPGNPDPDSEVIALSPKTLMATNRFVCEVCKKGFQRDQNLQLHRRGHNLPWKLKQRNNKEIIKRKVYVCPETSCVHHDPSRALGDLTGIKKHFFRKHGEKKWKCEKCSKRYAVQSDWKAHSKTCGTREYRCDCGTLFSRRDSFITHRAFCDALAKESTIATIVQNRNPIFSSTQPTPPYHHINNFQVQNQFMQPFGTLKKEPQTFSLMNQQEFPPQWLSNFPQQGLGINQEFDENHERQNPNPSNLATNVPPPYPYQPTLSSVTSLYTSATALLQKAAQIGATMSNKNTCSSAPTMVERGGTHQGNHMHADDSNAGLHLTSHEEFSSGGFVNNLASYRNKAAESTACIAVGTTSSGPSPPTTHPQEDIMIMMNSLSSSNFDGSTFDDSFDGGFFLNPNKKYLQTNLHDFNGGGRGGGGGNDGMTRDFLGLRPMSHSDIFSIAGLGNCINSNSSTNDQESENQKPWQG